MAVGRSDVARYYDLSPQHPNDLPFYRGRLPSPKVRVLELGCGTGRVTAPLAEDCGFIHGLDHSAAMLAVCRSKLDKAGFLGSRAELTEGDISDFDLSDRFDLIIAPFRVIQNLGTEAQLDGLFECVRRHAAPRGRIIFNAFQPRRDRAGVLSSWARSGEELAWEVETAEGRVACFARRLRVTDPPLAVHPELVFRRYVDDQLMDEAVLKIVMRCFYPDELVERVEDAGFTVVGKWGGYSGERYGEGTELVVEFA